MFAAIALFVSFVFIVFYRLDIRESGANLYLIFKTLVSGVFVVTGAIGALLNKKRFAYTWVMLAGLTVGMFGDFCLAYQYSGGETWYYVGMAAFLVNAVLFGVGFYLLDKFRWRDVAIAAGVFAVLCAFLLIKCDRTGSMTVPVLCYTAVLTYTMSKAISVMISARSKKTATRVPLSEIAVFLIVSGTALWMLSDLLLGIDMFGNIRELVRDLSDKWRLTGSGNLVEANAFAYFIGQTLTACSVFYIGKTSVSE